MAKLYSDLLDGSGRRYYSSLASAPGGISPAPALLTLSGLQAGIFEQSTVFRSPVTATLALIGQSLASPANLTPATATLSASGQVPGRHTTLVITNSLPPDYTDLPSNAPTILFINTISPAPAQLSLQSIEINVSQGGNIGFLTPGVGYVSLETQSLNLTLIFVEVGVGAISLGGLPPALLTTGAARPDEVGGVIISGLAPTLERGFVWIDADPPPALTWTTTTGIAA